MYNFILFCIIRFSQRGQDECCVRGQWLSLSCQWELFIWMCVCNCGQLSHFLFFCSSFNILVFQTFWIFLLKSSDLSMVNPHISLNPQNPQIHGAILRFSEDFYCEIHRFHWQSSDLAQRIYFIKSSSRSEEFISFCRKCQCDSQQWGCLLHNLLCWSHFQFRLVFLRAGSFRTQI